MDLIDGKKISQTIKDELKNYVLNMEKKPTLCVILIGEDAGSKVYVNNKKKACEYIGINSKSYELPENTSEEELLNIIKKLNNDKDINGILVQLPLPKHINEEKIILSIDKNKDIDCFHPYNVGLTTIGESVFLPCTPSGVIQLLKRSNITIEGKNCVVVGRSNIVGKPMASLLLKENGTVTITHSKTKNLKEITKNAEILIVTIGIPKFITSEYVMNGAVIIDVGINRDENGKLCGDVDFNSVKEKCSYITPVPGGVGPMTIAMLMENVVKAMEIQNGEEKL